MTEKIYKDALDVLSVLGASISDRLERAISSIRISPTEENLDELITVVDDLNQIREEKKQRMFLFGDESKMMVMRCFVLTVTKDWSDDSRPMLKINEMPEGVTMKDNPIRNMFLIYDDIDLRDRDFDRLKIVLNNEGGNNRK